MDTKVMLETADWIDDGGVDPRDFDMKKYDKCLLGHCWLHSTGRRLTPAELDIHCDPAHTLFGISWSAPEWEFLFGVFSYNDLGHAADRLRYVALFEKRPTQAEFDGWRAKRYDKLSPMPVQA